MFGVRERRDTWVPPYKGITGGCGACRRRGVVTPPYGCEARGRGAGGTSRTPSPTRGMRCLQAGRRENRRSAAGGGRSEPVSRKCPDWRPRQWTGIGWHDGGQSPTPTHSGMIFIKCHCEERSDVAIRFPLTTRGWCGGECGLPHQCAHWFAMTGFRAFSACRRRGVVTPPYGGGARRRGAGGRPYKNCPGRAGAKFSLDYPRKK